MIFTLSTPRSTRLVTVIVALLLVIFPSAAHAAGSRLSVAFYDGGGAAYVVRLTGTSRCTGAIYGTNKVVTAAHCVFEKGKLKQGVTVEYKGVTYTPAFVIANPTQPVNGVDPRGDVAILTFTTKFPGPSVTIGTRLPGRGRVTAIGYQPTDASGALVRPKSYNDKSHLKPGINVFTMRLSGCELDAAALKRYPTHFSGTCGMIPGGSGGPILEIRPEGAVLHGVLSTVNDSLTTNTWAGAEPIMQVVNRSGGVKVLSLNGPVVGAPPYRS